MSFNVPEEEKPKFNKNVQSGLNLFAKDVQRTLGQLKVLQPETIVEAYNKPVQAPVLPDLTPLERYAYAEQPQQEVADIATPPARESMAVPQEDPNLLPEFANQAQAQFGGDMISITPEQQASTDLVAAEVDSIRNEAGEIPKSALELFSKPLNANSVRVLGLVDQEGNPTERGQLFYNLQQSGVFNEDGTINEKGNAYLTPIDDMINPEWFNQPGNKEKFDLLWEDGVIRSSSTPGDILSGLTKFVGDAAYGAAELTQQQAMGLAYNSRTWGGLLGMEDSRPDYLKARGDVTELSVAENMYKNVIQTSNLIDVGLAGDKQFIDESIMSPLYGALEKITNIQRPQPQEVDQANANIKNSKDALIAARYNQWATDQRLADMEAGQIAETILGIDNSVQKAEAAKQKLGAEEFNKVYGRVGAFTNIAGDPTNAVPAAFAVKASRAVPLASRAMLNAQKTMGKIAAMDLAIAQGNTAMQASRAALAKAEPTVNLAQRMSVNFAEGAKTQPALLERSAKASQIAQRVTAEANQIKSTLPTITAELDNLVAKRNSLATRIPEEYSKKVLQTMELGRQVRSMPAKAVGATLERVGDTISKTDNAVTNFLQERGLDQMYTAAVGAAGVVGLAGNPIIGAIGAGAAALKTGKVLSNYGKLFRYVGKEMENVRGQIPFWKRVAAHTAPGSLGRGIAHAFNMLDLGGVTSDTLRRTGRGIVAAAPTDLMFEYLSDGADMRPDTLYQAAAESLVIGGSFAAAGGAFMGTKKRMRELSIGDELNFRRGLTDTRQKALFEAVPAGTRRAISTYAIANPTLNYIFKDSGASRYDPNTNTAVINVKSTNPIKALVAHETLHHGVIKNNMEPGISALFLGDTKNNTVGGLFRSRDGKLDPNFEAFRDGYYKRLGVDGMSNAERDAIYPLDKIAVEYFIEKHADQYAAMAESGELGAVAASGAARRKLGSILETVLPRIPVLKDLHFKSGGMIDKNGAWVTGNGILDAEGVKRDPITSKMFRDMNRRSAGLVPGQFDPLMSDKPDSGAPILLNPADGIDAELLHPLVQVDDANKPIMKDGKPVALDRATELSRALAGLTAKEVLQRKRSENYAPEKGEAYVDDEGQFQPGWLSNDVLTEMFAKNNYNPEQKRIIREMNKLIRKGAGDRVVMINFPATTRNKAGKVVYKPQGATLRDTVPVAVTISKDGNLLFGLMSVTKLHENIQKRSQDRRGKKLYGGNVDLILRDTQAMMDYHKQGVDSIEFFKQKYGVVEADERRKFINTMFGLLNQKEQAVLNPILLEDGVKSRDNVYRTYRADRVSKAVPMSPDEYPAMPFSYEAVSAVRMPEQRQMPEVAVVPERFTGSKEDVDRRGKYVEPPGFFKRFNIDSYERGGRFFDAANGEDLTGKQYATGSIDVSTGKPRLFVDNISDVTKSGAKFKTNLFKQSAGWKWTSENPPSTSTIVSVEGQGKHVYSLKANFESGVELARYSEKKSEPRLRPTAYGELKLGNQVGEISIRGKLHPVYDSIGVTSKAQGSRLMPEISPEDLNPVANKQEAQGLWADGKRMFALNEMDERLTPITSKAMLDSYSADAIGWMEQETQKSVASSANQVQEGQVNERQTTTIQTQPSGTSVGRPETTREGLRQQGGLSRGTEQLQPQGRPSDQGIPLTGLPATVTVPGIGKYTFGPNEAARNIAAEYARSAGIDYNPPRTYAEVDTERAKRIADEYEKMVHNPNDPKVKESYDAMIKETLDQWEAIKRTGLKVEPIPAGSPDPYEASPRLAIIDVKDNNHLWFFPTESGFGGTESAQVDISGNPLMQPTGEVLDGHVMLANDVFRIVHDYFGHIKEGVGFRADGEENAWRSHSAMYSDKARPAMTAETRGQNSWVNFGPFAEFNKTAKGSETQYAPQKTGLLPDWVMREGASDQRFMPEKDADVKVVETSDETTEQGTPAPDSDVQSLPLTGNPIPWDRMLSRQVRFMPESNRDAFPTMTPQLLAEIENETPTLAAIHIDRMKVGEYMGIDLQGGMFYPTIKENLDNGVVWAFNSTGVARTVANRAAQNGGYVKLVLMQEGNVVGNKTFANIWFKILSDAVDNKQISKGLALTELNAARRTVYKTLQGKDVKKNPWVTKHAEPWNSLDEAKEAILSMPQIERGATYFKKSKTITKSEGEKIAYQALLAQKMAKLGFPDAKKIVSDIEEPAFKGIPTGAAVAILKFDPLGADEKIMTAKEAGVPEHMSYGYVLKGKPVAKLGYYQVVEETFPATKGQIMTQQHTDFPVRDSVPSKKAARGEIQYASAIANAAKLK